MGAIADRVFTTGFEPADLATHATDPCLADSHDRRHLRVLHVEDDGFDQDQFDRAAAQSIDYALDIIHCQSKTEARALMAEGGFDLVFLDFWLGTETCLSLVDDIVDGGRQLPVIILSNLCSDDIEAIANRAGATAFLSKSDISGRALDDTIGRLTSGPVSEALPIAPDCAPDMSTLDVRDLIRALDAVHANSAVANIALANGQVEEAHGFLKNTIETASSLRSALFTLVERQESSAVLSPVLEPFDVRDRIANAIERIADDAEARAIQFVFRRPFRPVWSQSDVQAFDRIVETLMTTLIWRAEAGSTIAVALNGAADVMLTLAYRPDRIIHFDDGHRDDGILNTTLSELDREATKLGGGIVIERSGDTLIATLTLPQSAN